jgi:hypothetical protein
MIFVNYDHTNQRLIILNEDGTLDKVITCSQYLCIDFVS